MDMKSVNNTRHKIHLMSWET